MAEFGSLVKQWLPSIIVRMIYLILTLYLFAVCSLAMAGFNVGRLISYVANQLIVDGLANSRAFQRFAVRTNDKLKNISKLAEEKKIDITQQFKEISNEMKETLKK